MNSLPLLVAFPGDQVLIQVGNSLEPATVTNATVTRLNGRDVHRYTVVIGGKLRTVSKLNIFPHAD